MQKAQAKAEIKKSEKEKMKDDFYTWVMDITGEMKRGNIARIEWEAKLLGFIERSWEIFEE